MTTSTQTLSSWLLDQIAADEAAVYAWDSDGKARVAVMWTGNAPGYTTVASGRGDDGWIADGKEVLDARHVQVLYDPARVLATCAAHRRIVELHSGSRICPTCAGNPPVVYGERSGQALPTGKTVPCPTLRALAAIYAYRDGYREEWAL